MKIPFFSRIPKSTTWEELRDRLLSAIEEEKRKEAIASLIPTDIHTEIPTDIHPEIPSAPEDEDTVLNGCTADQGSYEHSFYSQRSYSLSEGVNKEPYS